MSNDPDDDPPTCPLCGEYVYWAWGVGLVCDHCEDEAERLEARAAEQPEPDDEGIF